MRDGSHWLAHRTPGNELTMRGNADERRKPAGGVAVHVDGSYMPRKVEGEKRVQREIKAA